MPTRSHGPSASVFLLAAVGAVGVVCLGIIGAIALFGGDDGSAQNEPELQAATSTLPLFGSPEADVEGSVAPSTAIATDTTAAPAADTTVAGPDTTAAPAADTTVAGPDTTTAPAADTTAPPTTAAEPTAAPATPPDVPESKAVVRNGQIFLEGAVPTEEAGAAIAALAAEILGPDNVFNDYVIDPRAGDPNLGNVTVEDTINFATGSAEILPDADLLLNQGFALMTIRPAMTVVIVGHTDDRGSDEYNLELSIERAESVKQWFVDRGIDADRITAVGEGESTPIADNSTADGRRLNRRIQFFLENILGDA